MSLLTGAAKPNGSNWRDYLLDAYYKGIPFCVDSDDLSGGRRGATHEYPYRDAPENEDMGHKAREYKVTAYVIGERWQSERDALLKVLEQGGSGELQHPHYGLQQVWAKTWNVRHSTNKQREVSFEITFVQDTKTRQHKQGQNKRVNVAAKAHQNYTVQDSYYQSNAIDTLEQWQ